MFKLTQNKRDKELLELVAKFMNCGAVYSHGLVHLLVVLVLPYGIWQTAYGKRHKVRGKVVLIFIK
jgi:hypothetical protein